MPAMTSRERIHASLEFKPVDRLPVDLAGMRSTGISAFAYPALVQVLGLPPRLPRVYDTGQMLAFPERDVLDALGCDCVTVEEYVTNAFDQPEIWHPYDFGGRLPALVQNPADFTALPDGTVLQHGGRTQMPPASTVFDAEHGGYAIDLDGDIPPPDADEARRNAENRIFRAGEAERLAAFCHRVRAAAPDKAVFANFWHTNAGIGIGVGQYPMVCLMYPDEVYECHKAAADSCVRNMERLFPLVPDDIDILLVSADDWGTQSSLMASPDVFRELFQPFYRQINDAAHALLPRLKTFLHCCGAVHPLIPDIADCHFNVLNPVQWSAGGRPPAEWKSAAAGRIALWGGGVNAQATLPFRDADAVADEVRRVVPELSRGGGYVFCNTHNILAEVTPDKILAMYRAAHAL